MAQDGGYVGRPVLRTEDRRLLTGAGCFVADLDRDGQLHACIVRSGVARGHLGAIDTAAAAARPGVVRVVTAADLPDVRIPIRALPTERAERALQAPLARDQVLYVGDPIAVVVAEDPYLAEDAAAEVYAEIEPLEPVLDHVAAAEDGAPVLHAALGSNVVDRWASERGAAELDALFAGAAVVVSESLGVQRHGSVPLETRGLLAEVDAAGRLTVWGAAKVKDFNRRTLAALLDVPVERVRLVEVDVGGSFGARGEFYPEDFLIPWLALQLGRPVKWVEDRRENLLALNQSREQDWTVELAAAADGTLLALRARGVFNQGAYVRTHGGALIPRIMLSHLIGPYRWQAHRIETLSVLTDKTPSGTCRGPGQYEATFVRERLLDVAAGELGLDPAELRRRNLVTTAEMPYQPGVPTARGVHDPVIYDAGDFEQTFELLLSHVGYERLRAEVGARQAAGELVGLGLATFVELGDAGTFEQSRIVPQADGSFLVQVGIGSLGQGVETVLAQIAADRLGVPIERVRLDYRDTDLVPEGQGAFSSRATIFGGRAVAGAIADLHDRARAAAAERLGVPADALTLEAGVVRSADGELTLAELGVEGAFRYEATGHLHTLMGVNAALVELDAESGSVAVVRYAIAVEIGRAINPLTVRGQVRGAVAQGIGGALLEEFRYTEDGQPQSITFIDYALPTAVEIPDIDVLVLELAEAVPDDPLAGVKGVGEAGIIGSGAAVANAVADALGPAGRAILRLPITPQIVQRLAAGRGQEALR